MVTLVVGFLNSILIPVFMKGRVKSTASALEEVIVKSTTAMSAFPLIISPERQRKSNQMNEQIIDCNLDIVFNNMRIK